jgi:predicted TIM-barrel fold metal-dependent hydrolase
MVRIDAHVHAFPDRLALAVRGRLGANDRLSGGVLLDDVAALVERSRFDRAWVLPYAHRAGVAESANEWSAENVKHFPSLVPGGTFHPADDNFEALVDRALADLQLRVVKLHCAVGQFSPADLRLEPLWRTASSMGVPIVIHAGQVSPGDTAASEIEELGPVLAAHPSLRIILAHTGHPDSATALALMARFDNLYADLTPVWDRPVEITARDIRRFPGRFLFGRDAPNNPIPPDQQAMRFEQMGLGADELASLMGGAAAELIPSP